MVLHAVFPESNQNQINTFCDHPLPLKHHRFSTQAFEVLLRTTVFLRSLDLRGDGCVEAIPPATRFLFYVCH